MTGDSLDAVSKGIDDELLRILRIPQEKLKGVLLLGEKEIHNLRKVDQEKDIATIRRPKY